jgi:succinoglycan biosynthesis protein ExoA
METSFVNQEIVLSVVPSLSVVMPVRNEEAHLGAIVRQLLDQSLDSSRYEILVVDGMSDDGTRDVVKELQTDNPHLHLLDNQVCLASSARNIGAKKARGRFVLFVDGHCRIVYDDMLEKILEAFENGERCVSRPQPLVSAGMENFGEGIALARSSIIGHFTGSKIYNRQDRHCNPLTAGCGYERKLFWELGGIDEKFDAAEDLEFNYRVHQAGVAAFHSDKFTIEYRPRSNFMGLFRQLYRYGYGRARMTRKYPATFSLLSTLLGVLGFWFLVLPVLGLLWPPAWILFVATLAPYASLTAVASAWEARGRNPLLWMKTWSAFPAIHFGAGLGYLVGLFRGPDLSQKACSHTAEN